MKCWETCILQNKSSLASPATQDSSGLCIHFLTPCCCFFHVDLPRNIGCPTKSEQGQNKANVMMSLWTALQGIRRVNTEPVSLAEQQEGVSLAQRLWQVPTCVKAHVPGTETWLLLGTFVHKGCSRFSSWTNLFCFHCCLAGNSSTSVLQKNLYFPAVKSQARSTFF